MIIRDYKNFAENSIDYIRKVVSNGGYKGPKYYRNLKMLKVIPGFAVDYLIGSTKIALPASLSSIFSQIQKYDKTVQADRKGQAYNDFRKIAFAVIMYILSIVNLKKNTTVPFEFFISLIDSHRAIYHLSACENRNGSYCDFRQMTSYFFSDLSLNGLYYPALSLSLNERHLIWFDHLNVNTNDKKNYPIPTTKKEHINLIEYVHATIVKLASMIDKLLLVWNERDSYLAPDSITLSMEKDFNNFLNLLQEEGECSYYMKSYLVNDPVMLDTLWEVGRAKDEVDLISSTARSINKLTNQKTYLPYPKLEALMHARIEIREIKTQLKNVLDDWKKIDVNERVYDSHKRKAIAEIIAKGNYKYITIGDEDRFHFDSKATRNTEDDILSAISDREWGIKKITKSKVRFQLDCFERFYPLRNSKYVNV